MAGYDLRNRHVTSSDKEDFIDLTKDEYLDDKDKVLKRGLSQTDVNCGVCYEILILATTLRCGHNFCKPCLANWYMTSKKKECPVCRQQYIEKPEVNNLISDLIEKTFKEQVEERKSKYLTDENKELIRKYDKAMETQIPSPTGGAANIRQHFNWNRDRNRNGADFCSGLLFMLGITVVLYLVYYWRNLDDGILVRKPVIHWSVHDVQEWLNTMPWTQGYSESFQNNSIDGRLLLTLEENHLTSILKIELPLHKAALLSAIESLRGSGIKKPSTLWEFKSLHPGYALFLLFGIRDYPRLTFLYLYFFDYYNMFIPLVHTTCSEEDITSANLYETLTSSDLIEFFTKMVFLPYFIVAQFAWYYLDIHYWTSRFVLAECLALTIIEATTVRWIISGGWRRDIVPALQSLLKGVVGTVVCIILWPVIPNFICDIFFYLTMYCSPYLDLEKVYKIFRTGNLP